MSKTINRVELLGRLGTDPELRHTQGGTAIVPLRLYIKGRVAKVLLGLAKGKRRYSKKEALIARDLDREAERHMKEER